MTEVKPTWVLAWGLFWRMALISLGVYGIIFAILLAVIGVSLIPFLGAW